MDDKLDFQEKLAIKRKEKVQQVGLNPYKLSQKSIPRRAVSAFMEGKEVANAHYYDIVAALVLAATGGIKADDFLELYTELSPGKKLDEDWDQIRESPASNEIFIRSNTDASKQLESLWGFTPSDPNPKFLRTDEPEENQIKFMKDAAVVRRINLIAYNLQLEEDDIEHINTLMATSTSIVEKQSRGPFTFEDAEDLRLQQKGKREQHEKFVDATKKLKKKKIFVEICIITRPCTYFAGGNPVAEIKTNSLLTVVSKSDIIRLIIDDGEVRHMDL